MAMRITQAPATSLIPDSPSGLWLEDGLSARLNPRAALQALAHAIRASGGRIDTLLEKKASTEEILDALYVTALARRPAKAEAAAAAELPKVSAKRRIGPVGMGKRSPHENGDSLCSRPGCFSQSKGQRIIKGNHQCTSSAISRPAPSP